MSEIDLHIPLYKVMQKEVMAVCAEDSMIKVASIFDTHLFHHIPVVDSDNIPVGMISKQDYFQLQHHFTRLKFGDTEETNRRYFESLCAGEVMTKSPVCLEQEVSLKEALDILLENYYRSIIVCDQRKLAGLITPIDILRLIR